MQSWAISEEYLWDQLKSKSLVLVLDWSFLGNLFICNFSSSWYGMKLSLRLACSSPKPCSSALQFFLCGEGRPWGWGWSMAEPQAVAIPTHSQFPFPMPCLSWSQLSSSSLLGGTSPHILCLPWPAFSEKLFPIIQSLCGVRVVPPH